MKKIMLLTIFLCFGFILNAQEQPSPILFIYDASGSMWGQLDGQTKKEIASSVLASTVGNLPNNQNVGLIAYGHRKKGDCDDIEYMVDLSNHSKTKITDAIEKMNPTGKTPLARSATMAITSLKENNTKATIILITDGIESCDGNICNVVTEAKANGVDFKLHIVGFGLKDGETKQLKCAANAGGGHYYNVADAGGLGDVLNEVTTQTVDKPNENFSIYATKNGAPVDAWIKATKSGSKEAVDGSRTYRDSGWVYLPPGKYDIAIRPLEGTDIPGTTITVEMKEGDIKHENISFDGGTLEVFATNNGKGWDTSVKMIDVNTGKVATNVRTYGKVKTMEVPAGNYKITFQALVLKGNDTYFEADNIKVSANSTTPISHNFESGFAKIGAQTSSGELIDATVNFHDVNSDKRITGARTYTSAKSNPREFLLNPGTYTVYLRTLGKHKGHSDSFTITVKAGETVEKITTF
ncbi:vWA domain-containing protein [Winogradskyella schleiferi]|uniref:vWA domain-containing protein n=1 Tax=Winogradskyella schleiferi TaxID=2686078 RepID=UPI0015B856BA|nr:VWA domain-containing protein [Winogradskyella schleiferi]